MMSEEGKRTQLLREAIEGLEEAMKDHVDGDAEGLIYPGPYFGRSKGVRRDSL